MYHVSREHGILHAHHALYMSGFGHANQRNIQRSEHENQENDGENVSHFSIPYSKTCNTL